MKRRNSSPTADRQRLLAERQLSRCNNPDLAPVVKRNIEAIDAHRREAEEGRRFQERVADVITWFSGSMPFIYLHILFFSAWIVLNSRMSPFAPFDAYPYGMLTTIVSLEAIFLSTFVLVSQNRQAIIADRRNELDLQINLLTEYEVTRILMLIDKLAKEQHINTCDDSELEELEKDVRPAELLDELEQRAEHVDKKREAREGDR